MKTLSVAAFALVLLLAAPLYTQGPEPMVQHWDQTVQRRLSQCFIAESDEASNDWTAIAYALRNWLKVRQRRYPLLRFADVMNSVCSVHKLGSAQLSKRQLWIRSLDLPYGIAEDGEYLIRKPRGFPSASSWERKKDYWLKALAHAQSWYDRRYKDPCGGKAVLWGAPSNPNNKWYLKTDDPKLKDMKVVRLTCSDTLSNDYYRLMTRREREERTEAVESEGLAQGGSGPTRSGSCSDC